MWLHTHILCWLLLLTSSDSNCICCIGRTRNFLYVYKTGGPKYLEKVASNTYGWPIALRKIFFPPENGQYGSLRATLWNLKQRNSRAKPVIKIIILLDIYLDSKSFSDIAKWSCSSLRYNTNTNHLKTLISCIWCFTIKLFPLVSKCGQASCCDYSKRFKKSVSAARLGVLKRSEFLSVFFIFVVLLFMRL